ncbi:MAG: anti-sigma factor, partial [Lapillicoccus sp.]
SFRATTEQLSVLIGAQPPERLREQILRDISLVRPIPPEVSREAAARIDERGRVSGAPTSSPSAEVTPISSRAQRRAGTSAQRVNRWFAAAAAVVVLGGGTVAALHPWDRQSQVQVGLADRVIQAPDAQRFQQTVAAGGTATVVRSKSVGKAVLVTENLASAPVGKVYQLWLEAAGGSFVSAGLLPTGANQTVVLDGDAATALGAGISVEPTGGSAQPTTTPVALIGFA